MEIMEVGVKQFYHFVVKTERWNFLQRKFKLKGIIWQELGEGFLIVSLNKEMAQRYTCLNICPLGQSKQCPPDELSPRAERFKKSICEISLGALCDSYVTGRIG